MTQAAPQRPTKAKKADKVKLPHRSSVSKYIQAKLVPYHAQRGSMFAVKGLDDAERLRLLGEYQVVELVKKQVSDQYNLQRIPLEEYFEEVKRLTKKQDRILSRVEKRISFGPKVENLIYLIVDLVLKELGKLEKNNPELLKDYIDGKFKTYTLLTSTKSLAKVLNRNKLQGDALPNEAEDEEAHNKNGEGSFRGKKTGLYKSLEHCGFVVQKRNKSLTGKVQEDGFSVELTIDLDWIFGWFMQIPLGELADFSPDKIFPILGESGNTTHLSHIISKNSTKESGFENSADDSEKAENPCQPNFQEIQPTKVGNKNHSVEGQASKPEEKKSQGFFAAAAAASPQPVDNALAEAKKVEKLSNNAVKSVIKNLYTPENFGKNRIRINKIALYTFISPRDYESMCDKMFDCYYHINQANKHTDWAQTDKEILESIEKTAQYYQTHSGEYMYSPLHFLNPDMATRSLVFAHKLYFGSETPKTAHAKTQMKTDPLMYVPTEGGIFENYDWLVQEKGEYSLSLARYAKKLGKDTVDDAIRFVRAKYKRGFRSKNGMIPYIFGVIANTDTTPEGKAKIKNDADKEDVLAKAGIKLGEEHKRKATGGSNQVAVENREGGVTDNGQWATDNAEIEIPLSEEKDPLIPFMERVKPIAVKIAELHKTAIAPEMVVKIAQRAMDKNANNDQIFIWCEGVAKGTSKLFG
jgi:hypothetical protein